MNPSASSPAMPMLLQATAVCAIAWQQALPEAQVETDSACNGVLKSVWLWRFNNRRIENTGRKAQFDQHQKLNPKCEHVINIVGKHKEITQLPLNQLSQFSGTLYHLSKTQESDEEAVLS